jgi:[protein-PII] uridylyltransferase
MRSLSDLDMKLAGRAISEDEPWAGELGMADDAAAIAGVLQRYRTAAIERILKPRESGGSYTPRDFGLQLSAHLTGLMDSMMRRMFVVACKRSGCDRDRLPMAVVATGGYGRRELAPFSDVDITFVTVRDGDPNVDKVIRAMFTLVMDVVTTRCGLEVGYAYRLLDDCASLDHQTQSGLLDARFVTGSSRLFIQLEDAFWTGFNATDFIFTKIGEREKVLRKWGITPRVVEPELKEGPGGLRDLQTAVWLVQAKNQLSAARVRGERAITALGDAHILEAEQQRVLIARERIQRVRNALHAAAGATRDHLVVTRQEEVARLLGYESDPAAEVPGVERFMAELYDDLSTLRRVAEQTIHRVRNGKLILGVGLDCKRQEIVPANDALDLEDPTWLLWAFELAQKYGLEIGQELQSTASALIATGPVPSDPAAVSAVFSRIVSSLGTVYNTLQEMADIGVLGWVLPEFGKLFNLIPYDPSHDFTVGQHSLFVVKEIEALLEDTGGEEQAEMRRVLLEIPHPEQLVMAALLHDSGKAIPGRPHDEISEEIASDVCARLGWDQEAIDNVCFLCRQHLVMAEVSRLRDLQIDETIRDFTQIVDDPDRLNMLYLLTYADTRAVGAGVWTQVKGRFLRDLWRRASAVLSEDEPLMLDDAAIARARRRLMKDLSLQNLPEEEVAEHIEAMPPAYLLNQSLTQIAVHINFVRQVRYGYPVIEFHDERDATYTEITVCAYDDPQPGLLAKIARVLFVADLEVHSAQVVTRVTDRDRIALDTLWVDYRGRQITPGKRRQVLTQLMPILEGKANPGDIAAQDGRIKRGVYVRQATTLVSVRNDLSDTLTVLETQEADTKGALYHASAAFARLGWDIRSARVSKWRDEARASFYLAGIRGLTEREIRMAFAQAVEAVLV